MPPIPTSWRCRLVPSAPLRSDDDTVPIDGDMEDSWGVEGVPSSTVAIETFLRHIEGLTVPPAEGCEGDAIISPSHRLVHGRSSGGAAGRLGDGDRAHGGAGGVVGGGIRAAYPTAAGDGSGSLDDDRSIDEEHGATLRAYGLQLLRTASRTVLSSGVNDVASPSISLTAGLLPPRVSHPPFPLPTPLPITTPPSSPSHLRFAASGAIAHRFNSALLSLHCY